MDLGIHLKSFTWSDGSAAIAETLSALAKAAEDAGCESISVMDHFFQMDAYAPADEPMLEGYTALGFLAAQTHRVQLKALVTGVTYRQPGILAKVVTTADVLSGGRAELGIGAAWYEREHRGLGVSFPPLAERFERLEETLQICLQMWSDNDGPYRGTHYQLAETLCSPQPLSRPHPRITIGGGGEKKTLRLVAKYGDACNLFSTSVEEVGHKLDVLRRHCDTEDRDYDTIRKTLLYMDDDGLADAPNFVEEMRRYHELGIEGVMVMPVGADVVEQIDKLGSDVIPQLASFG